MTFFKWHINYHGLFDAKAILVEEQQWYYLSYIWVRDKGVHTFSKNINLKVSIIARLEFKLDYFEAVEKYFSHNDIGTPLFLFWVNSPVL